MITRYLLLALALAAPAAASPASPAGCLERDWCTGLSPVSWGFSLTPPENSREFRLRAVSPSVRLLSATAGPGLPEGWEVELVGAAEAVVRGATAVKAGKTLRSCLVVETNRSCAAIEARGVEPIEWELRFTDESGIESAPQRLSFEPVMELADAQSRGIVLVTIESHGDAGPVEMTVDNPTWNPLWLDVPPGSVLTDANGGAWVVGLTRPFRMMRKQKTGRTVAAFPLNPNVQPRSKPRRLKLANRVHEKAPLVAELALAVRELEDRSARGERPPGRFEALEPFEFWPMVFRWTVWHEVSRPSEGLLESQVRELLQSRAAAGEQSAARLDPGSVVAEIRAAGDEALALRTAAKRGGLGLDLRCARVRFR